MNMVVEAGGLEALLERVSLKQQQLVENVVNQSDEKWQKRLEEQDAMWDARATGLLEKVGSITDDKIKKAMQASEKKQEMVMKKLREEMASQFKKEVDEVKSAVGAAGKSDTSSQPNTTSKIDHKIGNEGNRRTFRERDPGVLQFTGKDAIDKKQAVEVVGNTLLGLGITKEEYTFGGPPRGQRFSVKFKEGAAKCVQPKEAAKFVKESFKPKGDEKWKNVEFKRNPDGAAVEYSFQYDVASNQQIKEIITKHMYGMVKDKENGGMFTMYKRDGTLYKGFKCVARVIVGYKEDSFQIKWMDAQAFEASGVKTKEVEVELRSEFAKWCL
jgi:hypothetical protein